MIVLALKDRADAARFEVRAPLGRAFLDRSGNYHHVMSESYAERSRFKAEAAHALAARAREADVVRCACAACRGVS